MDSQVEIQQAESQNTIQQHPFSPKDADIKLFTFLLDSVVTNRYYILIGLFAHYGVVSLYFSLAQMKKESKLNDKNKNHTNKKLKITIIGLYWWFLASIFQFESFFWILWLILIGKTLQNYDHLIKYLDIFSCGNVGFFVYAIKSMVNMSGFDNDKRDNFRNYLYPIIYSLCNPINTLLMIFLFQKQKLFLPSVCLLFFVGLFRTIMTSLERTTFISRACFGFSVGYITALVLHKLQGQYWKELEDGYLISLLVIGFLAHLVLISYSKEDVQQQCEEEKKRN